MLAFEKGSVPKHLYSKEWYRSFEYRNWLFLEDRKEACLLCTTRHGAGGLLTVSSTKGVAASSSKKMGYTSHSCSRHHQEKKNAFLFFIHRKEDPCTPRNIRKISVTIHLFNDWNLINRSFHQTRTGTGVQMKQKHPRYYHDQMLRPGSIV